GGGGRAAGGGGPAPARGGGGGGVWDARGGGAPPPPPPPPATPVFGRDAARAHVARPADIDHEIGVGTHEGERAGQAALDQPAVALDRLAHPVTRTGAHDGVRLLQFGMHARQALEEAAIAPERPDAMQAAIALRGDVAKG